MKQAWYHNWLPGAVAVGVAGWIALAGVCSPAAAQSQPKPPQAGQQGPAPVEQPKPGVLKNMPVKTALACTPYGNGSVAAQVKVTNNTGATLAKGTMIYWQTIRGLSDKFPVTGNDGWQPNAWLIRINTDRLKQGPCSAYFYKYPTAPPGTP